MKTNGFHASSTGGKKVFAVSLIMAVVLAAVSAFSVFAASAPATAASKISAAQLHELDTDQAWYSSFISNRNDLAAAMKKEPHRTQQWLAQYAFALGQAEVIVNGHGQAMQQNLTGWLHEMSQLRGKLTKDAKNPVR